MNCQDITRIADTGSFGRLDNAKRGAAEAHVLTCRHCAPVWAVHARLADLRIPAMPAELSVRVRTLAALPAHRSGRPAMRRLTVVGSVVALAAAAAMFSLHQADEATPASRPAVLATTPATDSAPVLPTPQAPAPVVNEVTAPSVPVPEKARTQPPAPLPLLPAPVYSGAGQRDALVELALLKAVERHPELVEGPQIDDRYAVGVVLREDGTVVTSAARLTTRENYRDVDAEVERSLPRDAGGTTSSIRLKGTLLPSGRALRAYVMLRVATISLGYDVSRSNVRVQQILRDKYADQMLPASSTEMNRLTVFLSDDGSVQRTNLSRMDLSRMDPQNRRTIRGGDPDDAMFLAQAIAGRLELDVAQIGLMGVTALEEGSRVLVIDENGSIQPDDHRRVLPIYYAWQRRPGEPGPSFGQGNSSAGQSSFDPVAALAIVERLIPDAFTNKDPAAGQPTVVLTAKGEIIRAGRVKFGKGGAMDTILQEQLVPGVRTNSFSDVKVRNNLGETADVQFAWEMPPEMAKTMKEAGR